jgi:hypothetical protein
VERVNEGQYVPAGEPAFGTSEYNSMYGFWGMSWGASGLWVAPPPGDVDIQINNQFNNIDRGQINQQNLQNARNAYSSSSMAQATPWQRTDPRAKTTTTATGANAATARTNAANRAANASPATKQAAANAMAQRPKQPQSARPGRGDRPPTNPNVAAQNRQRVAAAFGDYGRGSNVSSARARGMQSRQSYGRSPGWSNRPPPTARQAPQQRNAFQSYGNGRQAQMQSARGRGSRGGRGR